MPPPTMPQRLAPLALRAALGLTFLWAGLGKINAELTVKGRNAAVLANMGVAPLTSVNHAKPEATPPATPTAKPAAPAPATPTKPAETPRPTPTEPLPQPKGGPPPLVVLAPPPATTTYSAEDFPSDVKVRRVYGLAILLHDAAHPAPDADGKPGMLLWPKAAGEGSWPIWLAWAVAVTELAGGFFLLTGFLTRLAAASIVGTMLGAVWLTQIGPAIQGGHTWLAFLPDYNPYDLASNGGKSYEVLLWQVTLAAAAFAVMLLGPGGLALDGLLFAKASAPPPKPPAPKPQ